MTPIDESTGKMIDANFMTTVPRQPGQVKVVKVKKPTMWPCKKCGKMTKSHRYPDSAVLCHGCFTMMTEEEQNGFTKAHSNRTSKEEERTV